MSSKGQRLITVVMLVLSLLLVTNALSFNHFSTAESSLAVHTDPTLLRATIPPVVILGKAYTAQVLVVNNSTQVLSGTAILALPTYYFYVDQPSQTFVVSPGQSEDLKYQFVAGNTYTGSLNATALLFVQNGSSYFLADSVTLQIISIVHSPLVRDLTQAGIIGLIAVIVVAITVYFVRQKKTQKTAIPATDNAPVDARNQSS